MITMLVDGGAGNYYDNDEDSLAYDQTGEYQQCQMEYIHDDSCILENAVPILDQHVSLS